MPLDHLTVRRSRASARSRLGLVAALTLSLSTACARAERGTSDSAATAATRDSVASPGTLHTDTASVAGDATPSGATATHPRVAAGAGMPSARPEDRPIVRALYVNRFAAQSSKRMRSLIDVADQTEINAFVIDLKDEFGLNYDPANPEFAKNAGTMGRIRDVKALVDTLVAHGILPIARLVVFKDSVTARVHPEWTIRRADGSIWRDHKGLAWVNPYHRELWDYNIGVAEELARIGFREIQFDYIRFPEPYKSLPSQVFPENRGESKPDALVEFLSTARTRLHKAGVRSTADIFGLVTTVGGALEVGQEWERLSPVTDVLLPMVYPSHYPRGSFGIPSPNADPYRTIFVAISRAHDRDAKLKTPDGEHVRPYLQAFTLGAPEYGAEQLRQQKRAVYDAGYDGWVLWNPGSKYEPYLGALEQGETVSHKKPWTGIAPDVLAASRR